jgi:hypothetical protein
MQGPFLRKYATQTTVDFVLYKIDGTALQPAATFAAGDVKVMLDEAAEANATNLPTDEGQTYSIVITAAQMTAARVAVILVDQTSPQLWLDTYLVIETYGHASAQHPFDLGTASTAQTGDSYARLGAPVGASIEVDIAAIKALVPAALVGGRIDASVGAMAANVVTAAAIADAAIDNATLAADVGSTAYATNVIALAVRKVLDILNLDHLLAVATAGADMTTEVVDNSILSRALATGDTSEFVPATHALQIVAEQASASEVWGEENAGHIQAIEADTSTDGVVVDSLTVTAKSHVNAEVVDALNVDTYAEPGQGAPAATASLVAKIGLLYKFARNKLTQTAMTLGVYNDAGDTVDQKAAVSDDGDVYTRGEIGSGP